jgi:hypothetical protein
MCRRFAAPGMQRWKRKRRRRNSQYNARDHAGEILAHPRVLCVVRAFL